MFNVLSFGRLRGAAILTSALLLSCAATSQAANLTYVINLNVASLTGNSHVPFSLDVALSCGGQTANSANTVTLSNFVFNGGSLGATTYSTGGETGSMASTVTLTTSAFDNELAQSFSASVTQIQFSVSMTNTTNNPAPDQFLVAILDSGLNNIPTTDPSGGNALVLANINSAQTIGSVQTYQSTAAGEAPGVIAAVPEPSSVAAFVAGIGALGALVWRRKVRRSQA